MSDLRYHRKYMLLPTVSQDTMGGWDGIITIKHSNDEALAADYKTESTYLTQDDAIDAAYLLGEKLIDSGEHEKTVRAKALHAPKQV